MVVVLTWQVWQRGLAAGEGGAANGRLEGSRADGGAQRALAEESGSHGDSQWVDRGEKRFTSRCRVVIVVSIADSKMMCGASDFPPAPQ